MGVSASTESSYTVPPEERGWHELSIAIIQTAVDDYRREKTAVLKDENDMGAQGAVMSLRTFFLSEMFEYISGVGSPILFLKKLDDEIESDYEEKTRRKRTKKVRVFK